MFMRKFTHYHQHDAMDCGPTCLRMVAKHHGRSFSIQNLRDNSYLSREGVSLFGISKAAESIGFRTIAVKASFAQLMEEAPLPAIVHWNQNHFVVVYKIVSGQNKTIVKVADPAGGLVNYTKEEFLRCWISDKQEGEDVGVALLLEPTPDFYSQEDEKLDKTRLGYLFSYLRPYRKLLVQLFLGLLVGSLLQLIFPFLTQSLVDYGIGNQKIGFIYLVLIAQLSLTVGKVSVEFIRGWILLHIGARINISLISDFLIKLMKLPMRYFDTKMVGDLIQRIGDHNRIESFLTGTTLSVAFAVFNLIIFGAVLAYYNLAIFAVFLFGSAIYFAWVWIFLKRRAELDHKRFAQMSANQSNLIQLIQGMPEIKLNSCEQQKRWEWERIQAKIFKVSIKGLALTQYQQSGAVLINESKNALISVFAASAVISGNMTLGMMLAAQYIIGQMNSPIDQLISFLNATQDAKLSIERLGEVHLRDNEEKEDGYYRTDIPKSADIAISNLSFSYDGPESDLVLQDLSLSILAGKTTAIVGMSGSGKTTLLKLLLGFYPQSKGEIRIGGNLLERYSINEWRKRCGIVMQDGFIFSDTIARNIAPADEVVDREKLIHASSVACILDFIESLPLGFNTKVGSDGHGLSQGQRQRMLIARAVYKNPDYIFFDEATNALDANNEKAIMGNLNEFFRGRTVVVVAHRLSTVRNADQIVVLDQGKITEVGTHRELVEKKVGYYQLVKNQLELGN
jgi:ATP-binding cassette subfamily B protein